MAPAKTRPNLWRYEPSNHTLLLLRSNGDFEYEIDLDECSTSAEVLDWIAQVAGKIWATDAVVADLVRALDDVLALQENLCGSGQSRKLKIKEWLARGVKIQPVEIQT